MPVNRSDYEIKIKSTADIAGIDQAKTGLKDLGDAAGEAGEGSKKAGEGIEEMIGGHHGIHAIGHALNQAMPGMMQFTRFLTSGFTAAIGVALLAFEYLKSKVEEFDKAIDDLSTGPGARGEWAEKMADNVRTAAVEEAVFNEHLRQTAAAQETLAQTTDQLIAKQKQQAENARAVGDAQKALALARLALAEKLGQISPDQAVIIRLQIDDEAFKRELAAKKAAIQAELSARQTEQTANTAREPDLHNAMDAARDKALAAKNTATKNAEKLAQDKKDLESLQEAQRKGQEGMSLDDFMPKWLSKFAQEGSMIDLAKSGPEQIAQMIAEKQRVIGQETKKETPLEIADAVAKQDAEKAKADYDEAAKLSHDISQTVQKLKNDLAAVTAQNDVLQNIHNQTSQVTADAANAETQNRVRSGQGTPAEQRQVADWDIQRRAASERGPQAGLDADDAIAKGRNIISNLYGQHGRQAPEQMAQIHEVLDQITGFLGNHSSEINSQRSDLQNVQSRLAEMETRFNSNR